MTTIEKAHLHTMAIKNNMHNHDFVLSATSLNFTVLAHCWASSHHITTKQLKKHQAR